MGRASLRITVQATLPVVPQGCFAFLAAVATINEGAKVQLFYRPRPEMRPVLYKAGKNGPTFFGAWAPGYLSPIPLSGFRYIC
jgi:hypothetical protein